MKIPEKYKAALELHKKWFLESGLMPDEGKLGVAERVLLLENNSAAEEALTKFPAWTEFENGCFIEQRRPDCCFETAYYFLCRYRRFQEPQDRIVCGNLLRYLYRRSGMLSRNPKSTGCDEGVWNWSDIRWTPAIWFDDNAWCIILALAISRMDPEFDKKYEIRKYALLGAAALAGGFERHWKKQDPYEKGKLYWSGNLELPHWGALAAGALAIAAAEEPDAEARCRYQEIDRTYFEFIRSGIDTFNYSELSYALLYCGISRKQALSAEKTALGKKLREILLAKVDPASCCLPSTHYEAPSGELLADLIYTMNWFCTAMLIFEKEEPSAESRKWLDRFSALLADIQDKTPQKELLGCWRGMYDVGSRCWGGGDRYEGGANSIYSGWTNAPLGWALLEYCFL